jgi:hypothetical protein
VSSGNEAEDSQIGAIFQSRSDGIVVLPNVSGAEIRVVSGSLGQRIVREVWRGEVEHHMVGYGQQDEGDEVDVFDAV